jgi:hypothetical protein
MKTFDDFLSKKDDFLSKKTVKDKFNNYYGNRDDYGLSIEGPIPGRTYEYYLNLFNSQTGGNLRPEHLEALKRHKETDNLYHRRMSDYRMARNTQENVSVEKQKLMCNDCLRLLGHDHKMTCKYNAELTRQDLSYGKRNEVKPEHCR